MNIELREIRKSFGRVAVVRDIDLEIGNGEFLILLGPSGCGKTTVLRLIAGLEDCDSGSVHIGGRDVTNLPAKFRDLAMVFQSYALYPHKTVAENIGFPLLLRGIKSSEKQKAVLEAAKMVRIDEFLDRYPRQLSGGQRQRVALARAIVRRPAAFLMDEPLSNLDAKLRAHMRAELRHIQREIGVTTVYVTHDQVEAMTLGDRVAILDQGKIAQLGIPREIYDNPQTLFVAEFVGSPPINTLAGIVDDGVFRADGAAIDVNAPSCADAVLGVRPEEITVTAAGEGDLAGTLYAKEMLGDCVLITCEAGASASHVSCKVDKDYPVPVGAHIGIRLGKKERRLVFNNADGTRIDTCG